MRRLITLATFSLLASACADNTPAGSRFTCRDPGGNRCADYVSGFTEDDARGLCESGSTFSTTEECPSGRTARCTATIGSGVLILYSYTLFDVPDQMAECAALGGDFVETF